MVVLARATLAVALIVGATGCAALMHRSQPKVSVPLDVPLPPPRVVQLPEAEPAEPSPPPVEEPASPPPTRAPRPAPPRPARPEKVEKPETTMPPAPPPDPGPALSLQTTANVNAEEQKIRALIAKAASDLARIDYRALSADGKVQYDTAKRFGQQAEDALKVKNLVFAEQLADKAATMAALLLGR